MLRSCCRCRQVGSEERLSQRMGVVRGISGEALNESNTWPSEVLVQERTLPVPPKGSCQVLGLHVPWLCRESPAGTGDRLQSNLHVSTGSVLQQEGKGKPSETCSCLSQRGNDQGRRRLYCFVHRVAGRSQRQSCFARAVGAANGHV